jgi:hypothetical protein
MGSGKLAMFTMIGLSIAASITLLIDSSLASPVPPPIEQSTANCVTPVYASDQLVCATPSLIMQDQRLKSLLDTRMQLSGDAFLESDSGWFKRRSMCAMLATHASCLADAYAERIEILEGLGPMAETSASDLRCRINEKMELKLVLSADTVTVRDGDGKVRGRAFAKKPESGWNHYLLFQRKGSKVILTNANGLSTSCQLEKAVAQDAKAVRPKSF